MKFYRHLYVGDSVKNPRMVKWKLRTGAGLFGVYVIAFADGDDQLEFYNAAFLKQKELRKMWPPYIIGIANGRLEATQIIEKIVSECYNATGAANLKDYLLGQNKR